MSFLKLSNGVRSTLNTGTSSTCYIQYSVKTGTYFWEVGRFILVIASIFLFMYFTTLRVTQNTKHYILVWPNNDFSILHLIPFPFSLFHVNSRFCKWYVQYPFVKTKSSSMYAHINPNPWNKSSIFCWKCLRN